MRVVVAEIVSRDFCQTSPPRWPIFPQNMKLDMHLPMLKMHKWQGEVAKMPMDYGLCNFDDRSHCPSTVPTWTHMMHFQIYALLPDALLQSPLYYFPYPRQCIVHSPYSRCFSNPFFKSRVPPPASHITFHRLSSKVLTRPYIIALMRS